VGLVVNLDDQLAEIDVVDHLRGRVRASLPPREELQIGTPSSFDNTPRSADQRSRQR
jgi:hypothetical protein